MKTEERIVKPLHIDDEHRRSISVPESRMLLFGTLLNRVKGKLERCSSVLTGIETELQEVEAETIPGEGSLLFRRAYGELLRHLQGEYHQLQQFKQAYEEEQRMFHNQVSKQEAALQETRKLVLFYYERANYLTKLTKRRQRFEPFSVEGASTNDGPSLLVSTARPIGGHVQTIVVKEQSLSEHPRLVSYRRMLTMIVMETWVHGSALLEQLYLLKDAYHDEYAQFEKWKQSGRVLWMWNFRNKEEEEAYKERLDSIDQHLQKLEGNFKTYQTWVSEINDRMKAMEQLAEAEESHHYDQQELKRELDEKVDEIQSLSDQYNELSSTVKELQGREAEYQEELKELKTMTTSLQQQKKEYQIQLKQLKKNLEYQKRQSQSERTKQPVQQQGSTGIDVSQYMQSAMPPNDKKGNYSVFNPHKYSLSQPSTHQKGE
ncbi:hypothetical protein N781_16980 [Pontibacillus halophilus JSM 076056 = DSM 19796]|uniref:Uncharacterized protein n=1 Tax=Pontibacillus halophilus JSM 076056 = DSM 19796 TaxID=1385510 RepID=A0A0A5GH16_9BACI|nr:hypothetical protein [Pontibacillus halophilus]KGX92516.1 hypothetical protein N781_16980 [Pontibacillus halophilus JSM 076056 = DSM 19796]